MPTRFERIIEDLEAEPVEECLGSEAMPPWVYDIYRNPCPYQEIVHGLEVRMMHRASSKGPKPYEFGHTFQASHPAWLAFLDHRDYEHDNEIQYVRREGLYIRRYDSLGITEIYVEVEGVPDTDRKLVDFRRGASPDRIEIYSKDHAGGWRAGPWWAKLDALVKTWSAEADALDATQERKEKARERAEKAKINNLYQKYLKGPQPAPVVTPRNALVHLPQKTRKV